jgi:hypothetical protein
VDPAGVYVREPPPLVGRVQGRLEPDLGTGIPIKAHFVGGATALLTAGLFG